MDKKITRRSFITGGLAAGAAIAGSAALGGCSPSDSSGATVKSSASSAVLDSSSLEAKWSFEVPDEAIADDKIADTVEADIIIVGAGPSGMTCALSALDAGVESVIILEKDSTFNALGGSMHAFNTRLAKELGFESTSDDISKAIELETSKMGKRCDEAKWLKAAYNSAEAQDWVRDYMEAEGCTAVMERGMVDPAGVYTAHIGSHSYISADKGVMIAGNGIEMQLTIFEKLITDKGGKIIYNTTAEQLVRGDAPNGTSGRVTAVIASSSDGTYTKYAGNKGIVLAAGDITQNEEMLAKFAPESYNCKNIRMSPNKGDGLKMALWVGAAPQRNWPWAANYTTPFIYGAVSMGLSYLGPQPYMPSPALSVNQNGERYMNEDGIMSPTATNQFKQPGQVVYSIWTANLAEALAPWTGFGSYFGGQVFTDVDAATVIAGWDEGVTDEQDTMKGFSSANAKLNSIAEISSKFNLPQDTLEATIKRYNEICAQGYDDDFGKRSGLLVPIETNGPFYVSKTTPMVMEVFGGPRCDANAHVLDSDNQIIEGLYEIGSMMGDVYSDIYTFLMPGVNMGMFCVTYGYMTGKALAEGSI